eukprot:TRINITY_DN8697_c0_g1_i5.p1 TRINITY_DN8697_c0_g1~~TRINITY_DN8697_c0_g1_i5.p1  ORF type:complete len:310 (+),score=88.09 TRINITY_DN8697_c0_g1_i5:153-1082(+)
MCIRDSINAEYGEARRWWMAQDPAKLAERAVRFYGGFQPKALNRSINARTEVVGSCQDLEKEYFRLTSDPDPALVRPPPVLRRSLKHVLRRWADGVTYLWCSSQLKAIRQDLVVQRVEDELAVDVYETNARLAIHEGDAAEYNQCQSVLKDLFAKMPDVGHPQEFAAYELLWQLSVNSSTDIIKCIKHISAGGVRMIAHPLVKHALNVASAINTDNYARFFKLYRKASSFEVSAALMSQLLPKVRKKALSRIGAAYRPGVPVGLIQEQLVFGTEEDCVTFLEEEGQKVQDSQVLLGGCLLYTSPSPRDS